MPRMKAEKNSDRITKDSLADSLYNVDVRYSKNLNNLQYKFQLANFRDELLTQAEAIVLEKFPAQVLAFNAALDSHEFSHARLPEVLLSVEDVVPTPKLNNHEQAMETDAPKKMRTQSGAICTFLVSFLPSNKNSRFLSNARLRLPRRSGQIQRKFDGGHEQGAQDASRHGRVDQQSEALDFVPCKQQKFFSCLIGTNFIFYFLDSTHRRRRQL